MNLLNVCGDPCHAGANRALAVEIVSDYLDIRGFGPVKETSAQEVRTRIHEKLANFHAADRQAA